MLLQHRYHCYIDRYRMSDFPDTCETRPRILIHSNSSHAHSITSSHTRNFSIIARMALLEEHPNGKTWIRSLIDVEGRELRGSDRTSKTRCNFVQWIQQRLRLQQIADQTGCGLNVLYCTTYHPLENFITLPFNSDHYSRFSSIVKERMSCVHWMCGHEAAFRHKRRAIGLLSLRLFSESPW